MPNRNPGPLVGGRAFDALNITGGLPLRFCFSQGWGKYVTCDFVIFVRLSRSACAAARPFRRSNQRPQGRIHGLLVGKMLSDIR